MMKSLPGETSCVSLLILCFRPFLFFNFETELPGAGTALLGKETTMACTTAVEELIAEHYNEQIMALLEDDPVEHAVLLEVTLECTIPNLGSPCVLYFKTRRCVCHVRLMPLHCKALILLWLSSVRGGTNPMYSHSILIAAVCTVKPVFQTLTKLRDDELHHYDVGVQNDGLKVITLPPTVSGMPFSSIKITFQLFVKALADESIVKFSHSPEPSSLPFLMQLFLLCNQTPTLLANWKGRALSQGTFSSGIKFSLLDFYYVPFPIYETKSSRHILSGLNFPD